MSEKKNQDPGSSQDDQDPKGTSAGKDKKPDNEGQGEDTIPKASYEAVRDKYKEAKAELETLRKELKDKEEAELKEKEKYKELYEKKEEETNALRENLNATRIVQAVQAEAIKQGIQDTDAAVKLVNMSDIEVGEDGTLSGVKGAVESLKSEKPYLVASSGKPNVGSGINPPVNKPTEGKIPGDAVTNAESFGEHMDDLVKLARKKMRDIYRGRGS